MGSRKKAAKLKPTQKLAEAERKIHDGPKFKAGRVDQFMAVYLPYCHQFVTNDKDQQKCLQEIAKLCGLKTQVRLYAEFYGSFMVLAS